MIFATPLKPHQSNDSYLEQGEGGQNEGIQNISGKYYAISMITR